MKYGYITGGKSIQHVKKLPLQSQRLRSFCQVAAVAGNKDVNVNDTTYCGPNTLGVDQPKDLPPGKVI